MRSAIFALCLALLAGAAIANLAPATHQPAEKLEVQAPIVISDAFMSTLSETSQRADCTGLPDLGDCSQFPVGNPGVTCDCDVPIPFGTCTISGYPQYSFPVTKCYGVNLCGVIYDLCT